MLGFEDFEAARPGAGGGGGTAGAGGDPVATGGRSGSGGGMAGGGTGGVSGTGGRGSGGAGGFVAAGGDSGAGGSNCGCAEPRSVCLDGGCGECEPGARGCHGHAVADCDAGGTWVDVTACAAPTSACSDGKCVMPSCVGLENICGPAGNESCCTTIRVPGGTFDRGNDARFPATLSAFDLDRFEVTVGRFRRFADAYSGEPSAGAGVHGRIPGTGWNLNWPMALDRATLTAPLDCHADIVTWTDQPGPHERRPINCVGWYDAFAFCAWDGGRLPTEAEWNYAAAGGAEQRVYPWSDPPSSTLIDATHRANCPSTVCVVDDLVEVGKLSPGDGLWGHADLTSNVLEWVLDWEAPYATPCINCATFGSGTYRVMRGGGLFTTNDDTTHRRSDTPNGRQAQLGFRCARNPGPATGGDAGVRGGAPD